MTNKFCKRMQQEDKFAAGKAFFELCSNALDDLLNWTEVTGVQ